MAKLLELLDCLIAELDGQAPFDEGAGELNLNRFKLLGEVLRAMGVPMVAQLRATSAELQKRVDTLEKRVTTRGSPGMPDNKPTSTTTPPVKKDRKKRPQGFGRTRMTPTEQVDHAVDTCPDCGTDLCGGWVQRTRDMCQRTK